MKANELMIGDWVMLTDPINNGEKVQVKEIHGDGYITVGGAITKMFVPIPLTAEILEKNGFWSQPNVGYVMEEHENEIIYDLLDYKLRILKNREQILNLECFGDMCVHELQHALRLVGVEKEIEL